MEGSVSRTLWPGLTSLLNRSAGFPPTVGGHAKFLDDVNKQKFNWMVFIVAASGFLTDSYNLFASNVILPAIAFVYWNGPGSDLPFAFNVITLVASAIGQVVFGFAADMYGRKSLYGIELVIVIISTIGLLQCSQGYMNPIDTSAHTWSFDAWLLFWRAIMGFGIGAEYPLSACIAAEWSSTQSRGRIMSTVFLMQPIGQLCAYGAGLTALDAFPGDSKVAIDKFWRYVIGIGVIPTLIAISFRLFMPESGRYEFDVINATSSRASTNGATVSNGAVGPRSEKVAVAKGIWRQFQPQEIRRYFSTDERHQKKFLGITMAWSQREKTLAGVCIAWFLLDIAFYGLGFNSPGTLAKLWASSNLNFPPNNTAPWWLVNSDVSPATYDVTDIHNNTETLSINQHFPAEVFATPLIRQVLRQNILHAIYTVSIASILGSILMIALINKLYRKRMLIISFLVLSVLLFAAFGSFATLFHQQQTHDFLIAFWVVISFMFSFGPNTLTFIIPAEVFPTQYRCTFYGIAAASGKLGSVVAQGLVYAVNNDANRETNGEGANSPKLRWLLLVFAICMLLGGIVSFLLPDLQYRSADPPHRIENYPLEYLELTEAQKEKVPKGNTQSKVLIKARSQRDESIS